VTGGGEVRALERRFRDRLKGVRTRSVGGAGPNRHSLMMMTASAALTIRARWAGVVIPCIVCKSLGSCVEKENVA